MTLKTANPGIFQMIADWNMLSEQVQLQLSRKALRHASAGIAEQAEMLADQMEDGIISDRGGPEALRLLASIVRTTCREPSAPVKVASRTAGRAAAAEAQLPMMIGRGRAASNARV